MNRTDKALLAIAGFMGGTSFSMLAFRRNHKDVLNESPWLWSFCLLICGAFCLKTIFKANKECT